MKVINIKNKNIWECQKLNGNLTKGQSKPWGSEKSCWDALLWGSEKKTIQRNLIREDELLLDPGKPCLTLYFYNTNNIHTHTQHSHADKHIIPWKIKVRKRLVKCGSCNFNVNLWLRTIIILPFLSIKHLIIKKNTASID